MNLMTIWCYYFFMVIIIIYILQYWKHRIVLELFTRKEPLKNIIIMKHPATCFVD